MFRFLKKLLALAPLLGLVWACGSPEGTGESAPQEEAPSSAAGQARERDPEATHRRAALKRYHQAVADRDVARARAAVEELAEALPSTPEATIELARMLSEVGEMNRASWMLQEASKRHPEHLLLILGVAETSLRVRDAVGAIRALDRVPEGAAEYPYARLLRSRAEILRGDLDAGLAILADAETRFPETKGFRMERIDVLIAEKRYDDALLLIRDKQLEPGLPEDMRGWLALREVDVVGARDGQEAALELLAPMLSTDPASGEILRRRAGILLATGRAELAVKEVEAGLAASGEAGLYGLLAHARLSSGDASGAEQALRDGVLEESGASGAINLAQFLHHRGRSGEAADVLAQLDDAIGGDEAIESRYMLIAMLIEAERVTEARRRFALFQRDYPSNPRVDYLMARFDLAEHDPEAAASKLSKVVARLDRSDVQHLLGVALELSGDVRGAEQRYGIAIKQNPMQVPSWIGLLRTLEAQAKWKQVIDVADKLARVDPLAGAAYASIARAYLKLELPDRAEPVLREYAERFPELSAPRASLALALRKQGRLDEAQRVLETAEREFPEAPDLLAERAIVLGQLGRTDEGLKLLELPNRDGEDVAPLRHARIYLLLHAGRADEALAEVDRAASLDPRDPAALVMAADFHASRGEFAAAAQRYDAALARTPMDAAVTFRMAIARDRAGEAVAAVSAYRRAIELDEDAIGARNNLALILERQGRLPEALEAAQAAYALAPSDPVIMDTLGSLYLSSGRGERGLALLENARSVDPASADVAYHLALAYREVGREEDARRLLSELDARLEPGHELRDPLGRALASPR